MNLILNNMMWHYECIMFAESAVVGENDRKSVEDQSWEIVQKMKATQLTCYFYRIEQVRVWGRWWVLFFSSADQEVTNRVYGIAFSSNPVDVYQRQLFLQITTSPRLHIG